MHDEGAPEDAEGAAPATEPALPLSAPERAAVLNGLPDDERGPAAAAVGALGAADADALVEVHHLDDYYNRHLGQVEGLNL